MSFVVSVRISRQAKEVFDKHCINIGEFVKKILSAKSILNTLYDVD